MPTLATVLWIIGVWALLSIVVPIVFGLLAARASKRDDERRRQALAVSMQRQHDA